MKNLILLIVCAMMMDGCKAQDTEHVQMEDIIILLKPKETTAFKTHNIRFDGVVDDSRCPEGTQCIWAGEAKITVVVLENKAERIQELVFGIEGINEKNTKQLWKTEAGEIHVVGLEPYPKDGVGIKPSEYRLLLKKVTNK